MVDEKIKIEEKKILSDPKLAMDKDVQALLDILHEKDNLIVSLKESSTQRDKLNEKQIRMLSEDSSNKLMQIKELQTKLHDMDSNLVKREAELSILRMTEGKLSDKVNEIKISFERYRAQVRQSIDQIKMAIQDELTRREDYKNKVIDELKDNYLKLEAQIQEVDNYYKSVVAEIAKKQGLAKKYIRHALNDLQESLSLLDISHAEYIEPSQIKEAFGKVVEDSAGLFQEAKEMKGLPQGATVIKNIENVNIKLSQVPEIEGIFKEITQISHEKQQVMEKTIKQGLQQGASQSSGGKSEDEKKKSEGDRGEGGDKGGALSDERSKAEEEEKKKKSQDDINEVIFKKGRNYAPFNWQEILSDIHLKRFQSFIQSCIKAEKEGNYTKALGLYKTIREQPGIANSIAGRLLDDHIEYLEDLLKRRYSINYRQGQPVPEKEKK